MVTGTHFYTASHEECARVIAQWSRTFSYEGVAYLVSIQNGTPVHRFFNHNTGTHFFTTSETERQLVLQNLPQFQYEGIAFCSAR